MPKEDRQNRTRRHERRSRRHHHHHGSSERSHSHITPSSTSASEVRISNTKYTVVIQSCKEMLTDIRLQIDELREQYQNKKTRKPSTSCSTSTTSTELSVNRLPGLLSSINEESSTSDKRVYTNVFETGNSYERSCSNFGKFPRLNPLHLFDNSNACTSSSSNKPTSSQSLDGLVGYLKSCHTRQSSVTQDCIDRVMSISSTCQLQLLEVSLQCPLSQAKIAVPVKTVSCQHLGCFDAKTFLQVMKLKKTKTEGWKCPICSANAELNQLQVDGFIQDIIDNTPKEAMKIEFTSSKKWRVKKETGTPISSKTKSLTRGVECIDLTYSPLQKKSAIIDLTLSP